MKRKGGKDRRKKEKLKAYVVTQILHPNQTSGALPVIIFANIVIVPGKHQLVLNHLPSEISSVYLLVAPQT